MAKKAKPAPANTAQATPRQPMLTPDVRALIDPLRAAGELERDDNQRRAEQILIRDRDMTPKEARAELLDYGDVLKLLAAEEAQRPAPAPPPLSPVAAAMYELLLQLPPHRAMTGKEIVDELNRRDAKLLIDESALRARHVPELEAYGLENKPRIGYRINPAGRPQAR